VLPRLENGNLSSQQPASLARFRLWCSAGVGVEGRGDWVFVKLHTHGVEDGKMAMLLGEPMRRFHKSLNEFAQDHHTFKYYYVTARELAGLVHQAELGHTVPDFTSAHAEVPASPPDLTTLATRRKAGD
jgi:hypothetical protein